MSGSVHSIFQTLLYSKDLKEQQSNLSLTQQAYYIKTSFPTDNANWICNTYTSLNSYDLKSDPIFQDLIKTITQETIVFGANYGIIGKPLICTDAWVNISKPGDFQEYHLHPGNHFSAVYYIKVPHNSGDIHFKSAEAFFDNFPLPCKEDSLFPASAHQIKVPAKEGMLLIFRSNLQHMVSQNSSDGDRISISMNFKYLAQ